MTNMISFRKLLFIFLATSIALSGCKKDVEIIPIDNSDKGYILLNEGGFGSNNANISLIQLGDTLIDNDFFENQNGVPFAGDILQSMTYHQGKAYLVLNNSNKIVVLDSTTFKYEKEITGISSPREVVFAGEKSFKTQLFTKSISVFNNGVPSSNITVGGDAEKMLISGNKLFVPVKIPWGETTDRVTGIQVIHLSKLDSIDFIPTINGAESLAKDASGNLWVLANGGSPWDSDNPKVKGRLYKINPATLEKIDSISFDDLNFGPTDLKRGWGGNSLYFREGNKIYELNPISKTFTEILNTSVTSAYGFFVDEARKRIFVMDAKDFSSNGAVEIYNLDSKELISTLTTNVGPSKIYPRY